jgi:hypothetical protein
MPMKKQRVFGFFGMAASVVVEWPKRAATM